MSVYKLKQWVKKIPNKSAIYRFHNIYYNFSFQVLVVQIFAPNLVIVTIFPILIQCFFFDPDKTLICTLLIKSSNLVAHNMNSQRCWYIENELCIKGQVHLVSHNFSKKQNLSNPIGNITNI